METIASPREAAGDPLEHQSGQHQQESRPNCDDQRARCNHDGAQRDRDSLRLDSIEQCSAGELTQQSCEPGCGQHKADVLLAPFLLGEECGDVRSEARQGSSEKQVNGIEAAQAGTRWRWFNCIRYSRGTPGDNHSVRLRLIAPQAS